jgi:hypothetical protein
MFYFELLLLVSKYLSEKDVRNLSYTCLQNRNLILEFELVKYRLNKMGSFRYAHELDFRRLVDKRGKVISVKIIGDSIIKDISFLRNIQEVYLNVCSSIEDVSPLSSAHKVFLRCCECIQDVTNLSGVNTLTIVHCNNVRNVSPLANVKNLSLKCLDFVEDIKSLAVVNSLHLAFLHLVRDVSVLRTVKNLTLNGLFLTEEEITILSENVPNLTIKNRRRM